MKKVKYYILLILYILSAILEFLWSVVVAITEAIGIKLTELTDALEAVKNNKT